jgi:hypothetical protein
MSQNTSAAAARAVYYIHKSRNIEISTVREARAAIAEQGPRIEVVNVTARFVDPGALITNAQANITSAMPMVTISDDRRIRVYACVQQADAPFVRIGDKAELTDASSPERKKVATVTRITGELDPKTRTICRTRSPTAAASRRCCRRRGSAQSFSDQWLTIHGASCCGVRSMPVPGPVGSASVPSAASGGGGHSARSALSVTSYSMNG